MKIKILSIFVAFLLAISSLSMVSADDIVIRSDHSQQILFGNIDPTPSSNSYHPQHYQISLTENIGVSENSPNKNDQKPQTPAVHNYGVELSEKINLTENQNSKIVLVVIKQNYDEKIITTRSNNKKSKNSIKILLFNGSFVVCLVFPLIFS